jgi:hypothetical protein
MKTSIISFAFLLGCGGAPFTATKPLAPDTGAIETAVDVTTDAGPAPEEASPEAPETSSGSSSLLSDASKDSSSTNSGGSSGSNQDACTPDDTGAVGTLGCTCAGAGTLACNGNAQKVTLICSSSGVWTYSETCSSGQLCDSAVGVNQGTCQAVDPACASASPGADVCSNATTAVECGPDLVSHSPVATCTNQACVSGACTGVCTPGATQCSATCTAIVCMAETCSMIGQWGPSTMCPGGQCGSGQPTCCPCV